VRAVERQGADPAPTRRGPRRAPLAIVVGALFAVPIAAPVRADPPPAPSDPAVRDATGLPPIPTPLPTPTPAGRPFTILGGEPGQPEAAPGLERRGRGMPTLDTSCPWAEEAGGTPLERAGFCQLHNDAQPEQERFIGVRTLADDILKDDPSSYRGHFLMGVAQHLGEANLPKSLYHLLRAEELLTDKHGRFPQASSPPWNVLRRILLELVYVHGEMDHHEEKVALVDALNARLGIDYAPLKAWPLLKLKRFDEARAALERALTEDAGPYDYWRSVALTARCAIESELRNREAAYAACTAAAAPVLTSPSEGGVALSNAASAAAEMFRFDEAERLWLESAKRDIEGTINPWGRLVGLYLRQGRLAEALSALREMRTYRLARPAYFDQQDQSDAELTGAALLLVAGRLDDALRITDRTVKRPDRQGTSSGAFEQTLAGNLLMDVVARRVVARRLEEDAVAAPFVEALRLRARAAWLRLEAWREARRAGTLLADPDRLYPSLRPECPGSVELPTWLDPEVVRVVGAGVARAAIAEARRQETLPEHLAAPIFDVLEAEASALDGDAAETFASAKRAVQTLGPGDILLKARAAALAADAARTLGRGDEAVALYAVALQHDPGVLRRLGLALPVEVVALDDDDATAEAARLVERSPAFDVGTFGFRLGLSSSVVRLSLPDGTEVASGAVPAGARGDADGLVRRILHAAHDELFVPEVDVTQADIRSLDGGIGGGGRASERAKSVLEEVLERKR
jgi:tetratricopeptide (TPR) repeat protein